MVNSNSVVLRSTTEACIGIGAVTPFSVLVIWKVIEAFVVRFVSNQKKSVKKNEGVYGELVLEELLVTEKLWVTKN